MAGGAFGAGKSVMLLNIASELVEQGARIWWLDAYQLQDAIDYLAQSDAASMPDVLAIDDVFDRRASAPRHRSIQHADGRSGAA